MGSLGPMEIILIILAIVLLFGAKKIPELMRGLGTGIKEFKKSMNDDEANNIKNNEDTNSK